MLPLLPTKQRIRESFDRAATSYDDAAILQRRVCEDLLAAWTPEAPPDSILDAGCGTGYGIRLLHRRWPDAHLTALDFAPAMLEQARQNPALCVAGDLEALPCRAASVAAWISSLTIQWCDTGQVFREAWRILRPGGYLATSTLGPDTFSELREAFAGIDNYRHTLVFNNSAAVEQALRDAGFTDIVLQQQSIRLHYPDLKTLLHAVKAIGANSVGDGARTGLFGRRAWQQVQAAYEQHRTPMGLPAHYDVIFAYARK